MAGTVAVAAIVLALSACGSGGGSPEDFPATASGKQIFTEKCGSCHALEAAGTSGTAGPDLDRSKPPKPNVLGAIGAGGMGTGKMPKGLVSGRDAEKVAQFVSAKAGK